MRCLACPPSQLESGGVEPNCQEAWPQACLQGYLQHQDQTQKILMCPVTATQACLLERRPRSPDGHLGVPLTNG